jgi:hypothetical protein
MLQSQCVLAQVTTSERNIPIETCH